MSYNPVNVNGSAVSSASSPVVIASDQAEVAVKAGTNLNTSSLATQATLASVLAKIIAAPATEATLATLALEATQLLIKAKTDNIDVLLSTRLKPADTLAAITAITNVVHIDDNSGSLTVDAPVGTPVFARLSDGAASLIGQKAMTASLPVVLASDQASVPVTLASGASAIAKAEDAASADADVGSPAMAVRKATPVNTSGTDGDYEMLQMSAGRLWASATIDAGTNVIGKVGIDQTTPGTTNAIRNTAGITGGSTPYKLISAATTNATSVKGSAATLYGIQVYNLNAAIRYLKLYNKASAPTVGTDTPVKIIMIPGSTTGAGSNVPIPSVGVAFGTGLAFALTTGIADTDTAAVAANEIVCNLDYN